jgi:hypothetical protein
MRNVGDKREVAEGRQLSAIYVVKSVIFINVQLRHRWASAPPELLGPYMYRQIETRPTQRVRQYLRLIIAPHRRHGLIFLLQQQELSFHHMSTYSNTVRLHMPPS